MILPDKWQYDHLSCFLCLSVHIFSSCPFTFTFYYYLWAQSDLKELLEDIATVCHFILTCCWLYFGMLFLCWWSFFLTYCLLYFVLLFLCSRIWKIFFFFFFFLNLLFNVKLLTLCSQSNWKSLMLPRVSFIVLFAVYCYFYINRATGRTGWSPSTGHPAHLLAVAERPAGQDLPEGARWHQEVCRGHQHCWNFPDRWGKITAGHFFFFLREWHYWVCGRHARLKIRGKSCLFIIFHWHFYIFYFY